MTTSCTTPHEPYPNETVRLLFERASLRNFTDEKIPPDVLQLILDAGNHAASGGNLQPISIIKVESEATRQELAQCCGRQSFIAKAPVALIFCIDLHRLQRWAELEKAPFSALRSFRHFWIAFQDTIIAAQNICTAADALGLGSVYVGTIIEALPLIKEMLKLPQGVMPVVLLSLGYPQKQPQVRSKLGTDILVHDETYRDISDTELLAAYHRKYEGTTYPITEERLETLERVCRDVKGTEFAQQCLDQVKAAGSINVAQRYFGLHYRANEMPLNNPKFLKTLYDFGFTWVKDIEITTEKE